MTKSIQEMLKKQYYASLSMLKEAIELCPDDLWARSSDVNKSWQIAYHALYFTHLYLQPTSESFQPWSGQQPHTLNDDSIPGPPQPNSELPLMPEPYTKAEVLAYWKFCWDMVESSVSDLDLSSESSGFYWYDPMPKLEHQFVNLRHLQHHAAQLAERLRTSCNIGIRWRGSVAPEN